MMRRLANLRAVCLTFYRAKYCGDVFEPLILREESDPVLLVVVLLGMRLHDLRHFAATRLLAAGIDVRTVSGRRGHANAATTLATYSHFIGAADVHAADVLGEIVGPKSKKS